MQEQNAFRKWLCKSVGPLLALSDSVGPLLALSDDRMPFLGEAVLATPNRQQAAAARASTIQQARVAFPTGSSDLSVGLWSRLEPRWQAPWRESDFYSFHMLELEVVPSDLSSLKCKWC